ncbi:MAG: flavodoxin-dependent (E)-4-hydroxy-3-methylbut-2-enyl-diphosphate synthase [Bacteroidales bacterium]|nr:flavodoxin-dependent (E)-4-hydroxy-3-methylbut-2-enyl-diphosphate synthase [Bacteroidales bacterium]
MMNTYPDKYCIDIHNLERIPTRPVKVGDMILGALNPVRLQSMTNVPAMDVERSVLQCKSIFDAGADFVRISTPRIMDVESLKEIKKQLHNDGYKNPLIADVHFNPVIAEEAARVVEKVRINPGNYVDKRAVFENAIFTDKEYKLELEKIHERIIPLIKICKEYGTAIRIGSNHGSLSDRIMTRYGNTVEGMVESAIEFIEIFVSEGFYNLVVSMKASDTKIMTQACRLLNARMLENAMLFPQHLGVTEAGADLDGRLKSAIGIGALLSDGIGDTIRVSLTESPVNEVHFAKKLVKNFSDRIFKFQVVSRYKNSYNPYISSNKYEVIPFISNKFAIISERDNEQIDLVFTKDVAKIPTNKPVIADLKTWKSLSRPDNVYPYFVFQPNEVPKIDNAYYYFVEFSTFDIHKKELSSLLEKPNVCAVLNFCTENPLGELRFVYKEIKKINKNLALIIRYVAQSLDKEELLAELGVFPGGGLVDNLASGLWLSVPDKSTDDVELQLELLQSIGIRYTKAEFISCPGCGRTDYDLEKLVQEVKKEFSYLKGLKIAVMGCIVNGPGEMADADFGCVGSAKGKVHIYKGKEVVLKNIPQEDAVRELKKVIENSQKLV